MEIKARYDIINALIKKHNYKSFLEIGYLNGDTHNKVECEYKDSVDINPKSGAKYITSSDYFFMTNKRDYDIVFIDGLHLSEQVDKDIENSLKHLTPGGTIVLHDCNPETESMQIRNDHGGPWTGDVWKSIFKHRFNLDLEVYVINTDYGCGVIKKGSQIPPSIEYNDSSLTWDTLAFNKKEMLNLISIEEFLNK